MTLSKDEYLEQSRALGTGFGPTVDFADPHVGTTVQSAGGIPTGAEQLPGQVFTVGQLPDPAVAKAYGLPPMPIPAHLIVEGDEAETHVQGPDVQDILHGELRDRLGNPTLAYDNTVTSPDNALKSFGEKTGEGVVPKTSTVVGHDTTPAGNPADPRDDAPSSEPDADGGQKADGVGEPGPDDKEGAGSADGDDKKEKVVEVERPANAAPKTTGHRPAARKDGDAPAK